MEIVYLKGPNKGITETIVEQDEDKGVPIYITETGKHLSNVDLNNLFRIKPNKAAVDLSDLGDPSLVGMEAEYLESSKTQGSPNPESNFQDTLRKNKENSKTAHKSTTNSKYTNTTRSLNPVVDGLFQSAKKTNKKITVPLNVSVPTLQFYNLIFNAIDIDKETFLEKVLKDINMDEIKASLKEQLLKIYEDAPKKPKPPKPPKDRIIKEGSIPTKPKEE